MHHDSLHILHDYFFSFFTVYTSIVYGCSIPHRHSDATQMDKMCVQFLYARRTFQMVAV